MLSKKVIITAGSISGVSVLSSFLIYNNFNRSSGPEIPVFNSRLEEEKVDRSFKSKDELESKEIEGTVFSFLFKDRLSKQQLICPTDSKPDLGSDQRLVWIICNRGGYKGELTLESKEYYNPSRIICRKSTDTKDTFDCFSEKTGSHLNSAVKMRKKYKGRASTDWAILVN
nr:hypothetical protein [Candidatus Mycoplasma haematolamae]